MINESYLKRRNAFLSLVGLFVIYSVVPSDYYDSFDCNSGPCVNKISEVLAVGSFYFFLISLIFNKNDFKEMKIVPKVAIGLCCVFSLAGIANEVFIGNFIVGGMFFWFIQALIWARCLFLFRAR